MGGTRVFNSRGQNVFDRVQGAIGTLFFIVMLFYAGFRGHRVVTQLPATYRTTQSPRTLPVKLISQMFPSKIPPSTYEFPALTLCAESPESTVTLASCYHKTVAGKTSCDPKGIVYRMYTFEGQTLNCTSVNEFPGASVIAGSSNDLLEVGARLSGTTNGSPDGVMVAVHPQVQPPNEPVADYENFFAASTLALTEVVGRKVISIDLSGDIKTWYEIKSSSVRLDLDPKNYQDDEKPLIIEFRYPKLDVTYEKSFLVLDMNNWLGEVGGVACLLFFLLRIFMAIVRFLLNLSDAFSITDMGTSFRREGFNNY